MEPIQDYAIIGDCHSAALVSRKGSIDWLCWPRFDSPSIFAALLDEHGGRWSICPEPPFQTTRRYVPQTNVLEGRFAAAGGVLVLTDLMPVASSEEGHASLFPSREIVRVARCESGEVEFVMVFEPRPDYGRQVPRIRNAGKLGMRIETRAGLLTLRADIPLEVMPGGESILVRTRLHAGESLHFCLTFESEWPAALPALPQHARQAIDGSVALWRRWASAFDYDGPAREAVLRSALALKLMVYAPSGAVVAAPTTSLPERIGGDLNWDYRFCWLRDASFTLRALYGLGFVQEAEAFLSWLLHTTRLTRPRLRILYDVYGDIPPSERLLTHLRGYHDSRPVRIGNAAVDQLQIDVYGEVIDAAMHFVLRGGVFDRESQRMLCEFGRYVCRNWRTEDEGIWEPRSGRRHNTHSRLLCWTALDRLLDLHSKGCVRGLDEAELRSNRDQIRREIETRAWNDRLQSYVAVLDGDTLDASLLLMAWYGFEPAASARMKRTFARVRERLGAGGALLYRYRASEGRREGAFGICSFWGAEFMALGGGSLQQARDAFEQLLACANDVGLFAEQIDPVTRSALGNFPQAFTHVGLINTALSIAAGERGREPIVRTAEPRKPEAAA